MRKIPCEENTYDLHDLITKYVRFTVVASSAVILACDT